jgi:hypothetical protein
VDLNTKQRKQKKKEKKSDPHYTSIQKQTAMSISRPNPHTPQAIYSTTHA